MNGSNYRFSEIGPKVRRRRIRHEPGMVIVEFKRRRAARRVSRGQPHAQFDLVRPGYVWLRNRRMIFYWRRLAADVRRGLKLPISESTTTRYSIAGKNSVMTLKP